MYKLIYFLAFLLISSSCYSQTKEDVYLKYVGGANGTCLYSNHPDGHDKQEITFTNKFHSGYFIMCEVYLQMIPHTEIGEMTEDEVSKVKVVDVDYLRRKREQNKEAQLGDPNKLFKIYILVPSKSKYLRFEVKWQDIVPTE